MNEDRIDYEKITEKYPWIIERDLNCIISPDADGLLCGLFMSHYLNWRIVGYYDNGKNLIIKNDIKPKDCIFLDTEIYRQNIKSIGHHITLLRKNNTDINLNNYQNCLNPNNLRERTLKENFSLKYPMGTIHLLISIIANNIKVEFSENSFFVVLQADGTINRFLDRYSTNLRDWLLYLGADDSEHVLYKMLNRHTTLLKINKEYVEYIKKFVNEKKDKILISDKQTIKDSSFNSEKTSFSETCMQSIIEYLKFLSGNTGWSIDNSKWTFDNFVLHGLIKKIVKPGVRNYNLAIEENFLSLAITGNDKMEYTIDDKNIF